MVTKIGSPAQAASSPAPVTAHTNAPLSPAPAPTTVRQPRGGAAFLRRHPLSSFFALAFAVSLAAFTALYLTVGAAPAGPSAVPIIYDLCYILAAGGSGLLLARLVGGRAGTREVVARLRRWRVGVRWYLPAIFTTSLAATIALLTLAATVSPDFLPPFLTGRLVVLMIPLSLAMGLMSGAGEEIAWTGFALPRLLDQYPAFAAALTLGVVWALWHAPIVFTRTVFQFGSLASEVLFLLALVPYRILMSWVYINGKRSLSLVIVMHALYDCSLAAVVPWTLTARQTAQFYGAMNIVLWLMVVAVVAVFGAERLSLGGSRGQIPSAPTPSPSLAG
jgi:membrane protease YdiL (CAAX protease family)